MVGNSMLSSMQPHTPLVISKFKPGEGKISVARHGSRVVISELAFAYPLRLTAPRVNHPDVVEVFMLTYGGGLVGGDQNDISIDVGPRATLGSTKVFKSRIEERHVTLKSPSAPNGPAGTADVHAAISLEEPHSVTVQNLKVLVGTESGMFLLPDPVTCYRSASYNQKQVFHLADKTATLVLLDWYTSGRSAMGEEWDFTRYYSANEVWLGGRRLAKDVTLLEKTQAGTHSGSRTLAAKLAPYKCYAMMILCGPMVEGVISELVEQQRMIAVFKAKNPAELMWSLSPLGDDKAVIVRVCATEVEPVKRWLATCLFSIKDAIGGDVYRNLFH